MGWQPAININALNVWEAKFTEDLADLRAGIDEFKDVAPQNDGERHQIFLLKKQTINTLVERVVSPHLNVVKMPIVEPIEG